MIGRIKGHVVPSVIGGGGSGDGGAVVLVAADDDVLVVDVNGVGYELHVPLGTVGRAATDADGRSTFHVHTHVREDALVLFGFASDGERLAFRTLISVSNVGPKIALAVLSALPAHELARAIAAKDVGRLTQIPGIGKKTAERLVLELRDKLPVSSVGGSAGLGAPAPVAQPGSPGEVLARALQNLGYKPAEAERAVQGLGARVEREPLPTLVREALAFLAK